MRNLRQQLQTQQIAVDRMRGALEEAHLELQEKDSQLRQRAAELLRRDAESSRLRYHADAAAAASAGSQPAQSGVAEPLKEERPQPSSGVRGAAASLFPEPLPFEEHGFFEPLGTAQTVEGMSSSLFPSPLPFEEHGLATPDTVAEDSVAAQLLQMPTRAPGRQEPPHQLPPLDRRPLQSSREASQAPSTEPSRSSSPRGSPRTSPREAGHMSLQPSPTGSSASRLHALPPPPLRPPPGAAQPLPAESLHAAAERPPPGPVEPFHVSWLAEGVSVQGAVQALNSGTWSQGALSRGASPVVSQAGSAPSTVAEDR